MRSGMTRMDVFQYAQKKEKRKTKNNDGAQNERQTFAVATVQRQRRPLGAFRVAVGAFETRDGLACGCRWQHVRRSNDAELGSTRHGSSFISTRNKESASAF